jgi:hypothetical protein
MRTFDTAAKRLVPVTLTLSLALFHSAAFAAPPWADSDEGKPGNGGKPNRPPTIEGTPSSSAEVDVYYAFQPSASDKDGDPLTFSIRNKPSWAAFDTADGFLSGFPSEADAGSVTSDIVISVTDGEHTASLSSFSISVGDAVNSPPVISGTPDPEAMVSEQYDFAPSASDPDGDPLTFSVANQPAWASFDTASGRLYGTPEAGDLGVYEAIRISVTDGTGTDAIEDFSITVVDTTTGTTTLSWTAPTENEDGSALTDLGGYRIYYGTASREYSSELAVQDAGVTTAVIENLSPGTWYFAATALNGDGLESSLSNEVQRVIE